jgi:transcriptional regulator with XRE-family HTH domain
MEQTFAKRPVHHGQNIQKFRIIRNMSQTDVAADLEVKRGKPVSQQFISDIEQKETIEDEELLKQIAEILKVDTEALKNLDLNAAINVIANTFTNHDHSQQQFATYISNTPVYNPLDKLIELFEKEKAELKAEIQMLRKGRNL